MRGSAPGVHGQGIANPVAMIGSGALMLDCPGRTPGAPADVMARHVQAHDAIVAAVERVLRDGPRSPDLDDTAYTRAVGAA